MKRLGKERNIQNGNFIIKAQSHKRKHETKKYLQNEYQDENQKRCENDDNAVASKLGAQCKHVTRKLWVQQDGNNTMQNEDRDNL